MEPLDSPLYGTGRPQGCDIEPDTPAQKMGTSKPVGLLARYIESVFPGSSIFRLSRKSLPRGIILSVGSFFFALRLAGFPHIEDLQGSHWEFLALLLAAWGMGETARCLQRRWTLYHAGVILLLYSDLMIIAGIVALLAIS